MGAIGAFTGLAFLLIFVVALGVATTDANAVTYLFFFIATLLFLASATHLSCYSWRILGTSARASHCQNAYHC